MRRIAALGLLIMLALSVPAQAQAPTPTSAVAVELEPGPVGIPIGGSHSFPFQVKLTLANLVCNQASTATVTLSIKDLPSPLNGVQGTVPPTLAFSVPMGNYASGVPGLSPYEQSMHATLSINVTTESLPNHEHTFEVKASFDGELTGCQGAGAIPSAEGTGQHQIKTGPAPAGGQARGAQSSGSSTADSGGGDKKAPGVDMPLLALGVAALAMLARRRR
ncbi:MAG: hypothetical protein ACYC2H_00605 [Thermoplasmatota archaeon]